MLTTDLKTQDVHIGIRAKTSIHYLGIPLKIDLGSLRSEGDKGRFSV